jgi:hypothetical protein
MEFKAPAQEYEVFCGGSRWSRIKKVKSLWANAFVDTSDTRECSIFSAKMQIIMINVQKPLVKALEEINLDLGKVAQVAGK